MCRDPVCGHDVDPETTPWTARYLEQVYHFCCEACLEAFSRSPQTYIHTESVCSLVEKMIGLA